MTQNKFERARTLTDKVYDFGYAIENLGCKVAVAIEKFADSMEQEITRQEREYMNARNDAMQRHPAGKGKSAGPFTTNTEGVTTKTGEPTREEKIKHIQNWLNNTDGVWHTDPGSIADDTVDSSYAYVVRFPKAGGTETKSWSRQYDNYGNPK